MTALVRQYVKAVATRIMVIKNPCTVTLWVGPTVDRHNIDEAIFIAYEEAKCTIATGVPLPKYHSIKLQLDAGTELWAMCPTEGLLIAGVDP